MQQVNEWRVGTLNADAEEVWTLQMKEEGCVMVIFVDRRVTLNVWRAAGLMPRSGLIPGRQVLLFPLRSPDTVQQVFP